MRMKHQRNADCRAFTRFLENCLEPPVGYRNEEIACGVQGGKRNTGTGAAESPAAEPAGRVLTNEDFLDMNSPFSYIKCPAPTGY